MSFLSTFVMSQLEKELLNLEPQIANFIVSQLKIVAQDLLVWSENKTNLDLNGDGIIGQPVAHE